MGIPINSTRGKVRVRIMYAVLCIYRRQIYIIPTRTVVCLSHLSKNNLFNFFTYYKHTVHYIEGSERHLTYRKPINCSKKHTQRIYISDTVEGTAPPCVFQTFAHPTSPAACSVRQSGSSRILQTDVWKTQGGVVPSITDIYIL